MEQQSNILGGQKNPVETKTGGIPAKERRKKIEDAEIIELFQFLGKFKNRYHQLKWVHPSGNDAGVWDISVPCPRLVPPGLTAHGMYLEIKTNNSKLSDNRGSVPDNRGVSGNSFPGPRGSVPDDCRLSIAQEYFGITMKRAGYVCVVVASWHEAARAILTYLGDCPAALKCLDQTEQKKRVTEDE